MTPADTQQLLRQAAATLTDLDAALSAEVDSGHYYWRGDPTCVAGILDGLGGPAGALLATLRPIAPHLALLLDAASQAKGPWAPELVSLARGVVESAARVRGVAPGLAGADQPTLDLHPEESPDV